MKCNYKRSFTRNVQQSVETDSDTETSGICVTGWQKRRDLLALRHQVLAAVMLLCAMLAPSKSYSETTSNQDVPVVLELYSLGKHGDTIARTREQVFEILRQDNACTAWYREVSSDPIEVFRSLHFELEERGPSLIFSMSDGNGRQVLKHPWAAKVTQNGGQNSTIRLNVNGPFFSRASVLMQLDSKRMLARPVGNHELAISSFPGNTPRAQITILLHELGHTVGRIPEDGDSWDGRSSRNTSEVLRHCKTEIHEAAHIGSTHSEWKMELQ